MIFVDTSAFYAVLDRDDQAHGLARTFWLEALSDPDFTDFVTSDYILVESFALIQARLGMEAVRSFHDAVLPVVHREWVRPEDHSVAAQAVLTANRRGLSLVDCTSFQIMRRTGIQRAFAFDRHFTEQGFELLPG